MAAEVAAAARALRAGGLVAFPTETVYGLGANARDADAVRRIYALKGRPPGHPLIVHLAAGAPLAPWARAVPEAARRLAERFWPGPLTLVLPRAPGVPDAVTGGQDSVALRVPAHPVAQALLAAFGDGVAAPSANRYGRVSPTSAAHVREEFGADAPLVLEGGDCTVGLESTILSLVEDEPLLLRPGHVGLAELESVVGRVRRARAGEGPRAPGTTRAHYAPATRLEVLDAAALDARLAEAALAVLARRPAPPRFAGVAWIDAGRDAAAYGHDLYAHLRRLDRAGARTLLVEAVPDTSEWEAVRDRLGRAAGPRCGGGAPDEDDAVRDAPEGP